MITLIEMQINEATIDIEKHIIFFFGSRAFIDMLDFTCVQVSRQGNKGLKRRYIKN